MLIENGKRFGRLKVVCLENGQNTSTKRYKCLCDCGNEKIVSEDNLLRGHTKSCGCLVREKNRLRSTDTILSKTSRLYRKWTQMRARCRCKNDANYERYGGRGIKVCEEWDSYSSFEKWAFENGYKEQHKRNEMTIERIDVNGDYSPSNCRFATSKEQANNRRNTKIIEYNGMRKSVSQWADYFHISYGLISNRLRRGWSMERIEKNEVMI